MKFELHPHQHVSLKQMTDFVDSHEGNPFIERCLEAQRFNAPQTVTKIPNLNVSKVSVAVRHNIRRKSLHRGLSYTPELAKFFNPKPVNPFWSCADIHTAFSRVNRSIVVTPKITPIVPSYF